MQTHFSIYLQVKQLSHLNGLASQHQAIKAHERGFQAWKTFQRHFSDLLLWPVEPLTKYKPTSKSLDACGVFSVCPSLPVLSIRKKNIHHTEDCISTNPNLQTTTYIWSSWLPKREWMPLNLKLFILQNFPFTKRVARIVPRHLYVPHLNLTFYHVFFHLCIKVYIELYIIDRHFCWNSKLIIHKVQGRGCTHHDISSPHNSTWVPCDIKNTLYIHKGMITCKEFSTERVLSSNIQLVLKFLNRPNNVYHSCFFSNNYQPCLWLKSSSVTFSLQQFSCLWDGELPLSTLTVFKNRCFSVCPWIWNCRIIPSALWFLGAALGHHM